MLTNLKHTILNTVINYMLLCSIGFYAHGFAPPAQTPQEKANYFKKYGFEYLRTIHNTTDRELDLDDLLGKPGSKLKSGELAALPHVDSCSQEKKSHLASQIRAFVCNPADRAALYHPKGEATKGPRPVKLLQPLNGQPNIGLRVHGDTLQIVPQ